MSGKFDKSGNFFIEDQTEATHTSSQSSEVANSDKNPQENQPLSDHAKYKKLEDSAAHAAKTGNITILRPSCLALLSARNNGRYQTDFRWVLQEAITANQAESIKNIFDIVKSFNVHTISSLFSYALEVGNPQVIACFDWLRDDQNNNPILHKNLCDYLPDLIALSKSEWVDSICNQSRDKRNYLQANVPIHIVDKLLIGLLDRIKHFDKEMVLCILKNLKGCFSYSILRDKLNEFFITAARTNQDWAIQYFIEEEKIEVISYTARRKAFKEAVLSERPTLVKLLLPYIADEDVKWADEYAQKKSLPAIHTAIRPDGELYKAAWDKNIDRFHPDCVSSTYEKKKIDEEQEVKEGELGEELDEAVRHNQTDLVDMLVKSKGAMLASYLQDPLLNAIWDEVMPVVTVLTKFASKETIQAAYRLAMSLNRLAFVEVILSQRGADIFPPSQPQHNLNQQAARTYLPSLASIARESLPEVPPSSSPSAPVAATKLK